MRPVIPKKKHVNNYLKRLHELIDNEQDFSNLARNSTFLSLITLNKLGIDIVKNLLAHESQSALSLEDIDEQKLIKLIKKEKIRLQYLMNVFPGFIFLLRLQERLINALLSLLHLLGISGVSPEDIHRLLIKIAALSREVEAQVYHLEMLQRHYLQQERRSLEMQERITKIYSTPQDKKEKYFKLDALGNEEEEPSVEEKAFANLFKTIFEFVLSKKDPETNMAYNNRFVSMQFEARLQSFCNELGYSFEKDLDGHTFLLKTNDPSSQYKITFKPEGVHFASEHDTQSDLNILNALIQLHEGVFEKLELKTEWAINAQNTTQAMKAITMMQSLGVNLDNLVAVNLAESISHSLSKGLALAAKLPLKINDPFHGPSK